HGTRRGRPLRRRRARVPGEPRLELGRLPFRPGERPAGRTLPRARRRRRAPDPAEPAARRAGRALLRDRRRFAARRPRGRPARDRDRALREPLPRDPRAAAHEAALTLAAQPRASASCILDAPARTWTSTCLASGKEPRVAMRTRRLGERAHGARALPARPRA